MISRRHLLTAVVMVFPALTGSMALAQLPPCQPGFATAMGGTHGKTYQMLFQVLNPQASALNNLLAAVNNQASYENLLNLANMIATNSSGRLLITLPDGTVVIDTARNDGAGDPKNNYYPNFVNKTINENHNSRAAIVSAQLWPCGLGVETKTSTTTGEVESYAARRLGPHLDSQGTARLSVKE